MTPLELILRFSSFLKYILEFFSLTSNKVYTHVLTSDLITLVVQRTPEHSDASRTSVGVLVSVATC